MDQLQQATIAEAMKRLWAQFLPQIEERVATLESAGDASAKGAISAAQCEQAVAAAHKLAGVLGTFGLPEGTELAREMEALYAAGPAALTDTGGRAKEVAAQLRAILTTRG